MQTSSTGGPGPPRIQSGAGSCHARPLAWLLALAVACAAPAPREPDKPEVVLSTPAVDRKVGEEASEDIASQFGLVDEPELSAYVSGLGRRLAVHAPGHDFDYEFQIVDEDPPNAFALPGGFIYVSRGLLTLSNSEDELANVLAHEIVHVYARHAAGRQTVEQNVPGPFQMLAGGFFARYSRDQEREADSAGQSLAAAAGYDPQGMAEFLRDLEFTERLEFGASRLPTFFDTHPPTAERAAAAAARARSITWQRQPGATSERIGYLRRLEGLTVGMSASEGVFQGDRFLHPDLDFSLRFPEGWELHNTRRAVGAISPQRDAQVFLVHQGPGSDPEVAAAEYLEEIRARGFRPDEVQPIKIGDLAAYRASGGTGSPAGPISVVLTWIAYNDSIYRLTGSGTGRTSKRHLGTFINVARSFRPLTELLRRSIHETRLHITTAREGESLGQLGERMQNEWDVQRTAVMNDLFANQPLAAGQLVKVAVSHLYEPTPDAR